MMTMSRQLMTSISDRQQLVLITAPPNDSGAAIKAVLIMPGHPYFEHTRPSAEPLPGGQTWAVNYRNFWGRRCRRANFETRGEASLFIEQLRMAPRMEAVSVFRPAELQLQDIVSADRYWRYNQKKEKAA